MTSTEYLDRLYEAAKLGLISAAARDALWTAYLAGQVKLSGNRPVVTERGRFVAQGAVNV